MLTLNPAQEALEEKYLGKPVVNLIDGTRGECYAVNGHAMHLAVRLEVGCMSAAVKEWEVEAST